MKVRLLMSAGLLLAASALASTANAQAYGAPPAGGAPGGGMGQRSPEERFAMMDANKDGSVSLEEYKAYSERMQAMRNGAGGPGGGGGGAAGAPGGGPPAGMMQMSPEDRFKAMDANKDGKVTLDEYKAFMEKMRQNMGGGPGGAPPAK
jgi:hypothetical protein